MGRKLDELIQYIGKPQFDDALWQMIQSSIEEIERGSGVTDLLYGMQSRQMRSAEEARVLDSNSTIRPDDMAEKADEWYSICAGKEWQVAVWHLSGSDVAPVVGDAAASVFDQTIVTQPFESFSRDYSYRVIADSARKPDRMTRKAALNEFGQVAMPMMLQMSQSGVMGPWNAYVEEFAKAIKLSDWEKFTVPGRGHAAGDADDCPNAGPGASGDERAAGTGPRRPRRSRCSG